MRFASDTGGTFTDLLVDDGSGEWTMFKASTTPDDPVRGVMDALEKAADARGEALADMLAKGEAFVHGTTHAINAMITGRTAKTAFFTSKGHPDILLMREGGRTQPFNHTMRYPDAYVPRQLTFEIGGRMNYAGQETEALDEASVMAAIEACSAAQVEAIGVCLLWSIANPDHEAQVGALLAAHLPGVPFSLSHQLNPTLREYRRASSTCIDASLKPLMADYLGSLAGRLSDAGYRGEVYVASSQGGMMQAADLAQAPIHVLNSGPSMAPVSGRYYGAREDASRPVIVADTGGTTYDVSLVRDGLIPMTREMWVGEPYLGHMTGFPSVDVKSVGAGGGSIARVDTGGILHVGPDSAGAVPGPACYDKGGEAPTLTDACVVLGYLDPNYFLGGTMAIDPQRAADAIQHKVAAPLGISLDEAAWAIVMLATENMAQAIIDITVNQGIDPAQAVLIGGGGAAGLNSTFISKRLDCAQLVIPEVGAALSAAGALMTDLSAEFSVTRFITTSDFDMDAANQTLDALNAQCEALRARSGDRVIDYSVLFKVEARYPSQVWEIELPLPVQRFDGKADIEALKQAFHETHDRIFAVRDDASEIEVVSWTAVAKCRVHETQDAGQLRGGESADRTPHTRRCYFGGAGWLDTAITSFENLATDEDHAGPAVVETPFSTIVIDPGARFMRSQANSLIVTHKAAAA